MADPGEEPEPEGNERLVHTVQLAGLVGQMAIGSGIESMVRIMDDTENESD